MVKRANDTPFSPDVLSLALYFSDDDGGLSRHWLPSEVYQRETIALNPTWNNADLYEEPINGSVAYVANLSRLIGPGEDLLPPGPPPHPSIKGLGAKDLVIIPFAKPDTAYLVQRNVYSDPNLCPPIVEDEDTGAIDMMALNQGVILANLPTAQGTGAGWTCYLLSLISLRSGALSGLDVKDKAKYFQALEPRNKR
ncbi:MAG: hypothetical protein WDO69_06575 [Pseudomonadota bacterium]